MKVCKWYLISRSLLSKPEVDVLLKSSIMKTRLNTHTTTIIIFVNFKQRFGQFITLFQMVLRKA